MALCIERNELIRSAVADWHVGRDAKRSPRICGQNDSLHHNPYITFRLSEAKCIRRFLVRMTRCRRNDGQWIWNKWRAVSTFPRFSPLNRSHSLDCRNFMGRSCAPFFPHTCTLCISIKAYYTYTAVRANHHEGMNASYWCANIQCNWCT